jgi:ribosomal protein S17
MGAKKNSDKKILQHRVKAMKDKVKIYKKYGISNRKYGKLEVKQARYEAHLIEVNGRPDY